MSALEIIAIIASVLIVGGVITRSILSRKKGKSSCGCDCANCTRCANKLKDK